MTDDILDLFGRASESTIVGGHEVVVLRLSAAGGIAIAHASREYQEAVSEAADGDRGAAVRAEASLQMHATWVRYGIQGQASHCEHEILESVPASVVYELANAVIDFQQASVEDAGKNSESAQS